ncbi:hypothetical protein ACQCRC_15480, partial [Ralstonia pseudosolanacearum]
MTCLRVPSRFSPWLAMVLALGCGVARAQFTGMPSGNGADPGAVSPDGVSGRHAGAVLVRIDWSTINYKDGLAITGRGP